MSVPLRSPWEWVAGVLTALALVLVPSTAGATYTGMQDTVTLGRMAVGAGWIVVPELERSVDPGFIDGTPSMTSTSSLQVARLSGPRALGHLTRSLRPGWTARTASASTRRP